MSDYIELPVRNILKEGVTTKPGFCNTKYVVYFDKIRPEYIERQAYDAYMDGAR